MCGITGIFGNLRKDEFDHSIGSMTDVLTHRGPDDSGTWVDKENGIAFGHRRLSIIDLSLFGHQPMVSPCEQFVVIFNGEIYNHLELRVLLGDCGNQIWRGHSDTETLVTAFSQWGVEKTLDKLTGMFAIAVWDVQEKKLTLIRDRFGEKPLYYGWSNGVFLFGSELKALRQYKGFDNQIDRNVLSLYMQYMYVPNPYSIFENIYKLEPGCMLKIDVVAFNQPPKEAPFAPFESQGFSIVPWYSLSDVARNSQKNLIKNEKEAIESLEQTLLESVRSQLITDVPLGAFLSGGIDSSIIVSLMQRASKTPVKTFTIGFEESAFNEATYAKRVSKHIGTDHYELYVTANDALKVVPDLPILYDEPFADSSQIPTYLISKLARQHVTVILSGDAGDELFGGYNRYLWGSRVWNKAKWVPPSLRSIMGNAVQKIPTSTWDLVGKSLPDKYKVSSMGDKAYRMAHRLKTVRSMDDVYHSLVTEGYKENSIVISDAPELKSKLNSCDIVSGIEEFEQRMMLWDSSTYLPDDILTKVDRATMGVGLEARTPFLNHKVFELAWRMPLDINIKNGEGKWPVRQVLYKYVPKELVDRPKAGFAIPVGHWIRGPLREWAGDLLDETRIKNDGYFDPHKVKQLWRQHLSGEYDWTTRLWAILMFQSWLDENNKK
jgi:asparagine synthase (glutamine-hydrolysing)